MATAPTIDIGTLLNFVFIILIFSMLMQMVRGLVPTGA
jgi:hypothetical protein